MTDEPEPTREPEVITLVLDRPEMSAKAWRDFIHRLLLKQSMRREPTTLKTLTISSSDEPDFYIVEEHGKG